MNSIKTKNHMGACPKGIHVNIDKFVEKIEIHTQKDEKEAEEALQEMFSRILKQALSSQCILCPREPKMDKQELTNQLHPKLDELSEVLKKTQYALLDYYVRTCALWLQEIQRNLH